MGVHSNWTLRLKMICINYRKMETSHYSLLYATGTHMTTCRPPVSDLPFEMINPHPLIDLVYEEALYQGSEVQMPSQVNKKVCE